MRTERPGIIVTLYCDICGRDLTNASRSESKDGEQHYCLSSPIPGEWVWNKLQGRNVQRAGLPPCYEMAELGVNFIRFNNGVINK